MGILARGWGKCRSHEDGECFWDECPQIRDGEPKKSGRHCPHDKAAKDVARKEDDELEELGRVKGSARRTR